VSAATLAPLHEGPKQKTQPSAGLGRRTEIVALVGVLLVAAVFRLPALDSVPNGLFLDEASRGYDAYSLLLTGCDQFGVPWPLFAEGLDDYTPALYTLLVVPSVALLGLDVVAVRLPAALVGVATVGMTYLAGRAYFGGAVGLVAAAFLAISPWHILPSRTGAEWALLPLFTTTGVWLLAKGRTSGPALLAAGVVLGVGLYSYAFARLLVPMLVLGFAVLWWRDLLRQRAWGLGALLVLAAFATPLIASGMTPAGQARLRAVIPLDRYSGLALVPYAFGNFLSYFDPRFLVGGAEPTDYHRLRGFGPVLLWMVPLLVAAGVAIARRPSRAWLRRPARRSTARARPRCCCSGRSRPGRFWRRLGPFGWSSGHGHGVRWQFWRRPV
jgi:4-amino-4-deoxy-L-arabinose transferase-like glycosyltransferase